MIGAALEAHLIADPTVYGYVGKRIYPGLAPDVAQYPLIQYLQVSTRRMPALDRLHQDKGPIIQVDIYATKSNGPWDSVAHVRLVEEIADAVEAAMQRFYGVYDDVDVKGCVLENERQLMEDAGALAHASQDYQVWWRRNT